MKTKFLVLALFAFSAIQSQTEVSFEIPNQEFVYSKETYVVKFKIEIKNLAQYGSNQILNLELFSDIEDSKILFSPTKSKGKDIAIKPTSYSGPIEIEVPINVQKISEINAITFTLKKKGINPNFNLGLFYHTVVLTKKKEKLKSKIGIISSNKELKIDFFNDDRIEIPFKIVATGYMPVAADTVSLKVKIKDIDDYNAKLGEFKVIGKESLQRITLMQGEDEKVFKSFAEKLKEKDKLVLEITELNNKSKNTVAKDEKNTSIEYSLKKTRTSKNRYDFYIGTNFDLKDRFEATSFYAEVDAWLPELIDNKWGIRAGLYKNNNSRSREEFSGIENISEIISSDKDSVTFEDKRVKSVPNIEIENFGLYLQALFKVIDEDNFSGHIALHFETIERNEKFTFNNSDLISLGQSTISIDSLTNSRGLLADLTRERDFSRRYYDSYYGLGFPMVYNNKKKSFSIFLNPIFGYGDPGLSNRIQGTRDLDDSNKFFGIFEFSLIEEKFGIKLSGEIRKYFGYLQNPIISINISKKINLANVFNSKDE